MIAIPPTEPAGVTVDLGQLSKLLYSQLDDKDKRAASISVFQEEYLNELRLAARNEIRKTLGLPIDSPSEAVTAGPTDDMQRTSLDEAIDVMLTNLLRLIVMLAVADLFLPLANDEERKQLLSTIQAENASDS